MWKIVRASEVSVFYIYIYIDNYYIIVIIIIIITIITSFTN